LPAKGLKTLRKSERHVMACSKILAFGYRLMQGFPSARASYMSVASHDPDDLPDFRRGNFGWLLLEVARDFQHRTLQGLHALGYTDLRVSHHAVFVNLGIEGARLVDLAARAGMTKQSMGQLVDDLQRLGYVERASDPSDGRAKIVRPTSRGTQFLQDAHGVLRQVTQQYETLLDAKRLAHVQAELTELLDQLGANVA
jgi:DNA-binding MarR family transcriptional regulator